MNILKELQTLTTIDLLIIAPLLKLSANNDSLQTYFKSSCFKELCKELLNKRKWTIEKIVNDQKKSHALKGAL